MRTKGSGNTISDAKQFQNGQQLACLAGVGAQTIRQRGKPTYISKRGDTYLRPLLTHDVRTLLRAIHYCSSCFNQLCLYLLSQRRYRSFPS
ncbi:transposase [Aeromonas veronii]